MFSFLDTQKMIVEYFQHISFSLNDFSTRFQPWKIGMVNAKTNIQEKVNFFSSRCIIKIASRIQLTEGLDFFR